jgi:hypothetical protein
MTTTELMRLELSEVEVLALLTAVELAEDVALTSGSVHAVQRASALARARRRLERALHLDGRRHITREEL